VVKTFYILKNPLNYARFRFKTLVKESRLSRVWIEDHSPLLAHLRKRLAEERPFEGAKVGVCLPGTWQSFMMLSTLRAGGASILYYPMFCQAEVGAELLKEKNIKLLKFNQLDKCVNQSHFVYDSTAVLGKIAVNNQVPLKGIIEQTASGIEIYRKYDAQGLLLQPVLNLDSSYVKKIWENKLATAFGLLESLFKLQIFLPSKKILVLGFGSIGAGCANYLKRIGCAVSVYDVDSSKTAEAEACGYQTATLDELLSHADIVVNASGSSVPVLEEKEMNLLKNGAILVNLGGVGWNREVFRSKRTQKVGDAISKVLLDKDKCVYELAHGYPVNFVLATGTDTETMDMVFSLAILAMEYLVKNHEALPKHLLPIPESIQAEHRRFIEEFGNIKNVEKTVEELTR
jgi:adenosylhomocysteinase